MPDRLPILQAPVPLPAVLNGLHCLHCTSSHSSEFLAVRLLLPPLLSNSSHLPGLSLPWSHLVEEGTPLCQHSACPFSLKGRAWVL